MGALSDEALAAYRAHTRDGRSLRQIAREAGVQPSTVLRRVRRVEEAREDPVVDQVVEQAPLAEATPEQTLADARALLAPGARAVFSADVPHAAVLQGERAVAQLPRDVLAVFASRHWIVGESVGRLRVYKPTPAGRRAIALLVAKVEDRAAPRRFRPTAETTFGRLARHRDGRGRPFLGDAEVAAAERLRLDFDLAQVGPRVAQDWQRFLTSGERRQFGHGSPGMREAPAAARAALAAALAELGPGLGDVALRCCCLLEGLEAVERDLGWSARSGKVVLRLALERLARHYAASGPPEGVIGRRGGPPEA